MESIQLERYTVPGIKDLPVACQTLFQNYGCDIVMALGMPGAEPIDKQCSHEASLGLMQVQLKEKKHVLEVFVHLDEGGNLMSITEDRTYKHTLNALALLKGKTELSRFAGQGKRQGSKDVGGLK